MSSTGCQQLHSRFEWSPSNDSIELRNFVLAITMGITSSVMLTRYDLLDGFCADMPRTEVVRCKNLSLASKRSREALQG